MPRNRKDTGFTSLLILLIILILVSALISVYLLIAGNKVSSVKPAASPLVSGLPMKVVSSSPSPKLRYALERKTGGNTEELFAISNDALFEIVRWNNLLIFSDGGQDDNNYPPDIQIKVHNIDTGKTTVIFNSKENAGQFNDIKRFPDSLGGLQVIGDTLYFSLGGYLKEGAVFWLDLPPSGKPQKLIAARNGSISKLRDWYFVIGGEGDSCWSERDFYLLDIKTKGTRKVAASKSGCNLGEESLGLSRDGEMIMAYHGSGGDNPYQGDYEYIAIMDILNTSIKRMAITREQMPAKVNNILYSEDRDQLLLIGSSFYLYDLAGGQLNKIADSPKEIKFYLAGRIWENDKVCLDGQSGPQYNKYELDISSKTLTKMGRTCDFVSSPTSKETTGFKKLIDSLNLPVNYRLAEN